MGVAEAATTEAARVLQHRRRVISLILESSPANHPSELSSLHIAIGKEEPTISSSDACHEAK
jgi:hypothetical protein